uniref:Uncharacterized protein n=1 Tax=Arundo donax TaxID=35708 RepID=A0A0A9A635_ARUDO
MYVELVGARRRISRRAPGIVGGTCAYVAGRSST